VLDLTYPPIILTAKAGFRLLGQRFDLTGTEHVPRRGGVLLAVNHVGYLDFIYGGLAANPSGRKVRFMAKREIFDHKISGPVMRSMHHIEVDRGEGLASFHTAVDYLRRGEAVGIFPEATISRSMELKELKTGAVLEETIAAYPVDEQPPGSWWLPARFGGGAPTPEEAERLDAEEKVRRAEAKRARQQG
jgi:1-acyl-sn-glycerol-3-phosphate acyltransferase